MECYLHDLKISLRWFRLTTKSQLSHFEAVRTKCLLKKMDLSDYEPSY